MSRWLKQWGLAKGSKRRKPRPLICSGRNRPIHEVLFSRHQDLATAYENRFQGTARTLVSLGALIETRQRLRRELGATLTS